MNKYDIKYIFKRVFIFFIIFVIMSFIKSCEAHAKTYQYVNDGSSVGLYPSGSNSINFNQWYEPSSNQALQTINLYLQSVENAANDSTLYNGVYLIDFYIVTSGLNDNLADCYGFSSDYRFIDLTSGNVISSAINIKSECVNSYYTRYNNSRAIHYLVQFKIDSTGYSYDLTTRELRLINRNYNGSGFVNYGVAYNVVYGGIYDYSSDIVTSFEQYAQNAKTNQSLDELNNNIRNQISNDNSNTNSIINNNNQNTQNIINNQDTNSQNEINNANTNSQNEINNANTNSQNEINAANQNTDKEIESQKACTNKIINRDNIEIDNATLNSSNGVAVIGSSGGGNGVTKYYSIDENTIIKNVQTAIGSLGYYMCFYNNNKEYISCINKSTYNGSENIQKPSNAKFVRFTINKENNKPQFEISSCTNGNQAINDSINDVNDTLNDDDVSGANSEVDSLLQNNAFDDSSGIQSIINAPLNFINGLTNSCSPINITLPYINSELSIPCIKQELTNHVPSLVPILSTAINGFVIYRILIDIVYLVKSSRDPNDDRIEVLDL